MNKKLITVLFIALTAAVWAQNTYTDSLGDFTYNLPDEWVLQEYPGLKYKIAVGKINDGFAQNITVVSESFDGTIQEYCMAAKKSLELYFVEYAISKDTAFMTDTGISAWKLIIENVQQKFHLRQYMYIFQKAEMFYIATCSVLTSDTDEIEKIFDASMKTFTPLQ